MLYISSDHGGFELKNKIIQFVTNKGYDVEDLGPFDLEKGDDYPEYVANLAEKMKDDPESKGILICRNGVGVSMFANKYKNIRAALSWNPQHAISSRADDDANVLALPSDYISDQNACETVEAWLQTPFSCSERHLRRLAEISSYLE